MKHLQQFEKFGGSPKAKRYGKFTISYDGDPNKLFLIYYTGNDDFISHDIVAEIADEDEGKAKFEEDQKSNAILNGANIYTYGEVLDMYKWIDEIVPEKNVKSWIKKENRMLNKYGFKIDQNWIIY